MTADDLSPNALHPDDLAALHGDVDSERDHLVRVAAAQWQRYLVDLGGRNSLLWQRTDDSVELDLTTAHPAGVAKLLSGRTVLLSEIVREPGAYAVAFEKALAVRGLARELMEERGIISCFLALGRATWQMAGDIVPAAPVLLRQCDIHFGGRTGEDLVLEVSRTVELNSALSTYLASRGVNIDHDFLTSLSSGPHGFDPAPTYAMLRRAGATIPGFRVDDKLILSTFSYAKLSMVRDVADQASTMGTHPVIAAMAGDEHSAHVVSAEAPAHGLDPDPREEFLVLDADSQQEAAIEAVMAGQHLVLMGPPGTGKSQTIANLVATLTAHGRSALFVAEKRAAIDAVIGRLDALGLGDLMLDAHARSGSAADLVDILARRLVTTPSPHVGQALHSTASPDGGVPGGEDDDVLDTLERQRADLIEHVRALHRIRDPFGVTAYEAQDAIAHLNDLPTPPRSRVRLEGEPLARLDQEARDETGRTLVLLAQRHAWRDDGAADPWFGARVRGQENLDATRDAVTGLAGGALAAHRARLDALFADAGLPPAPSMTVAQEALDLMAQVARTLESFTPDVFGEQLPGYVQATATRAERKETDASLGAFERRRLLKEARATLREGRPPSDLHAAFERAHAQQEHWKRLGGTGAATAPAGHAELMTEHRALCDELDMLSLRLEGSGGPTNLLTLTPDDLTERIDVLARNVDRLEVLPRVGPDIERLRARGLGAVIDDFAARGLGPDAVATEWSFIWWTSVLGRIRRHDRAYEEHSGNDLRACAKRFAEADRAHLAAAPARVQERAYRRVDDVARRHPEQVEAMESALVFGHHVGSEAALRHAFAGAPQLMTALAPCWAMSPLVVAQTIPPGQWFDVVIFDEASQIAPAEAISAISRGAQVVVAGDTQQLAPTSFLQRQTSAAADPDVNVSVLDVLAELLPVRHLRWHYRSLDERLIAFSNAAVYDGELITFPRAHTENILRLHVVDGGETRPVDPTAPVPQSTDAEVRAVVDLVREHARTRPHETLGVITVTLKHAQDVERAIARAVKRDADIAAFLSRHPEAPFFVKNLDRVQGDQRDTVILTLGISPTATSGLVRRFGSLNQPGGERRLNVAITRARHRMDVVSSFAGHDLEPGQLRSVGATMLRDFLLFVAQCDDRVEAPETSSDGVAVIGGKRRRAASSGSVALQRLGADVEPAPVSTLVEDLARRLRAEGLTVHTGYGHSRVRLDIAVEHPNDPGRMLLAVETDGPDYAAMGSVRERDRLRIEGFTRLGWHHDRVWSVDLFRDPARDASRIVELVRELVAAEES